MYIVIEIQTNPNGTVGNIVNAFATKDLAFQKFHTFWRRRRFLPCPSMRRSSLTTKDSRLPRSILSTLRR